MMGENKDIQAAFKPSEIIGIVSATLLKQSEAAQVVYVEAVCGADHKPGKASERTGQSASRGTGGVDCPAGQECR